MLLTREQILKTADYQTAEVEVPEWGGSVRIRSLTLRERGILFDRPNKTSTERLESEIFVVTSAVIDRDGNQLFSADDSAILSEKSQEAVERVANEILRLSGILKPEEVEKNSGAAPTAS